MSIARFCSKSWGCDIESDNGDYVLFEDHEAAMKAKDAEIAQLKRCVVELDYRRHDFLAYSDRFLDGQEKKLAEGQEIIDAKEAEIVKLRKVAATASRYVTFPCAHFRQELKAALAELGEGKA